jgi:hypothetical protein
VFHFALSGSAGGQFGLPVTQSKLDCIAVSQNSGSLLSVAKTTRLSNNTGATSLPRKKMLRNFVAFFF